MTLDFRPTIGGVSRIFNPRSIPGLKLWLDPSNSGSVTNVSGAVSSIQDLSGNGHTASQVTAGQRPTLVTNSSTGITSMRFTASSSQKLTFASSFSPGSTWTLFAVVRAGGPSGTAFLPVLGMTTNSQTALIEIASNVFYVQGGGGYAHANNILAGSGYRLATAAYTGSSDTSLWVDAVKHTDQTWSSTSKGNTIDQLGWGDNAYCNGEIGEILLYSGVLAAHRIEAINQYLWWKWFDPFQTTHISDHTTTAPSVAIRMTNGHVLAGGVDEFGNKYCDVATTTGIKKSVVLYQDTSGLGYDNHGHPAFVQLPDGSVVAVMTGHHQDYIRVSKSAVNDATRWTDAKQINGSWGYTQYTYSMPVYLPGDNGGTLHNFFRANSNQTFYTKSTDGGVTWSAPIWVFYPEPGKRPYVKPVANGNSRIDFCILGGNPNEEGAINIYHMYYLNGSFYKTTGGAAITLPFDPNDGSTLTNVYTDTGGRVGLDHDIAINASGRPVILYTACDDVGGLTGVYWRAEWSGSVWNKTQIATTGTSITGDPWEPGEGCIDPDNTNIVYVSRETGDGIHQIWKYTWGGSSWSGSAVTSYPEMCFHPMVVKGGTEPRLFFSRGPFGSFTTYTSKGQWHTS
jgi:hypothetical protein